MPQDQRENAASRGYGHRWRKARLGFLRKHPLCVDCERQGRTTPASVVDHIEPHRGNIARFWDSSNWQALCKTCHDSHKQREERSGVVPGCDTSGIPLDPGHHWHRGRGD